jgi:Flp pilus assembly protein TadD
MLGEVLSFSVHSDLIDKVTIVASEALKSGAAMTGVQSRLIHDLLRASDGEGLLASAVTQSDIEGHPFQGPIRRLRDLLRSAPDNTLALLDYAQLQAAVGKLDAAERAIRTALALSPNSRIVLRTAARYFVHAQKADLAHRILRQHTRTLSDPWLMASEIAVAGVAESTGYFLSKGKRFLQERRDFPSAHLTELAGVVADAELAAGNLKRAREAQRKALLAPNDNVVAQAVERERDFGIQLEGPQIDKALAKSNEALVLQGWAQLTPELVERHAKAWHQEEPFSSRPVQMLTTLYAQSGELDQALRWIRAGLLADAHDGGLLINLAFTQARMGQIPEAVTTLRKLRHLRTTDIEPFIRATEGLIAYQQHSFDAGDTLYDEAVALFEEAQKPGTAAYCRLNQAYSAIEYQHPNKDELVRKANSAFAAHPTLDSAMLLMVRNAPGILDVNLEEEEKRLLRQWVFDPAANTLTEKQGVTRIGASPLLILDPKGSSAKH